MGQKSGFRSGNNAISICFGPVRTGTRTGASGDGGVNRSRGQRRLRAEVLLQSQCERGQSNAAELQEVRFGSAENAAKPRRQRRRRVRPRPLSVAPRGEERRVSSLIGADLTIKGNLISKGEVQVDGAVEGDVHGSHVIVGPTALITGNVLAEEVIVRGHVVGSVRSKRVMLQSTSESKATSTISRCRSSRAPCLRASRAGRRGTPAKTRRPSRRPRQARRRGSPRRPSCRRRWPDGRWLRVKGCRKLKAPRTISRRFRLPVFQLRTDSACRSVRSSASASSIFFTRARSRRISSIEVHEAAAARRRRSRRGWRRNQHPVFLGSRHAQHRGLEITIAREKILLRDRIGQDRSQLAQVLRIGDPLPVDFIDHRFDHARRNSFLLTPSVPAPSLSLRRARAD